MPSATELPEGVEQQTASQASHAAEKTLAQSGQAPVKRTGTDRATETFQTTWIKKELVNIQLTKIKFDTDLRRGHTRERDEDLVLSRIASLRTNPPCWPISNILIWRNEGTLPSCLTHVGIFTHSGHSGTAVPISLISPISHLPVVHFCLSSNSLLLGWGSYLDGTPKTSLRILCELTGAAGLVTTRLRRGDQTRVSC